MKRQVHKKSGKYVIRIITAMKDKTFQITGEHSRDTFREARQDADTLQSEIDEDCDSARTYIYEEGNPVPFYAGLQMEIQQRNYHSLKNTSRY